MSDKVKFPWNALPWALIALGVDVGLMGAAALIDPELLPNALPAIAVAFFAVLLMLAPKIVPFLAFLSTAVGKVIATGFGETAGLTTVLSNETLVLALALIAFGSVMSVGKSMLSPRTLFVFGVNTASALGVAWALSSLDPIVQTPVGAAALLLGILLFVFTGPKKTPEVLVAAE